MRAVGAVTLSVLLMACGGGDDDATTTTGPGPADRLTATTLTDQDWAQAGREADVAGLAVVEELLRVNIRAEQPCNDDAIVSQLGAYAHGLGAADDAELRALAKDVVSTLGTAQSLCAEGAFAEAALVLEDFDDQHRRLRVRSQELADAA